MSDIGDFTRVGTKRRPKTQKRRPLQNRLEITLKWFERDYRPTQKQETTGFAVLNEFDQGLRFVHNPTKSTKRRPPKNRLEITSKWFERDCGQKQKRETTRFAVLNKIDQVLRFVHNPTKSTKRRPLQNCLEIISKWFERDSPPKQKQGTTRFKTRFAVINKFDQGLRFVHNPTKSTKRRSPQNRLEIISKWFERDSRPKQKRETTRFAFTNKFDQGLHFIHNPTKCTKRRPLQNCFEITSKWLEHDCRPKQKQGTTRLTTKFAVILRNFTTAFVLCFT